MWAGAGQAVPLPHGPQSQCTGGRIGLAGGGDESVLQLERVDDRPRQPGAPQPLARASEELGLDAREVHEQDATRQVSQQFGDGVGQQDPGRDVVVGEPAHRCAGPDRFVGLGSDDPVPRPGQYDAASVDGHPTDRQHPVEGGVHVGQRHGQRVAQRAGRRSLAGPATRPGEGESAQTHGHGHET